MIVCIIPVCYDSDPMRKPRHQINIQIRRGIKFNFPRLWLKAICLTVLEEEKAIEPIEIECIITDDATIQRLNKKFRNMDEPTDVLSFAFKDTCTNGARFPAVPGRPEVLGQIIISFSRAVTQAASHHHGVEQEMRLLMVHGMLHLLGYVHQIPADKRKMKRHEKRMLQRLEENQGPA